MSFILPGSQVSGGINDLGGEDKDEDEENS
jgi:hypothetical protein